jgi:hypothetical protein
MKLQRRKKKRIMKGLKLRYSIFLLWKSIELTLLKKQQILSKIMFKSVKNNLN